MTGTTGTPYRGVIVNQGAGMGSIVGRTRRLLLVVLLGAAAAAPAGTAQAAGNGPPVVLTPTKGAVAPQGFTGPLTADLSGAPYGTYRAELTCTSPVSTVYYTQSATFTYADESQAQLTWTFPPVVGPYDLCRAHVSNTENSWLSDLNAFDVEPPPLTFTEQVVTPAAFYPHVRDGYRDTVTVTFRVNQSVWDATMTVRDSTGTVVHTDDLGYVDADTYLPATWTWDGSTDRGGVAPTGGYTVHLSGTALSTGITGTATAADPVTVATGWTTTRVTRNRAGTRGVAAARGTCRVTRHTGYGEAHLSCSGGRFARMTYTFPLPANATHVRWGIAGQLSSADVCCDGVVRRTGWRAGDTQARVRVTVTGQRAYLVRRVGISYTARVRI